MMLMLMLSGNDDDAAVPSQTTNGLRHEGTGDIFIL
jgi:hypothetical protein